MGSRSNGRWKDPATRWLYSQIWGERRWLDRFRRPPKVQVIHNRPVRHGKRRRKKRGKRRGKKK